MILVNATERWRPGLLLGFNKNIIKLSKEFGTLFDGFEKEAKVLLRKLDQRSVLTKEPIHNNQLVPKDVRNLIVEVIYKDSEPRGELRKGRRPPISDQ